MAKIKIPRRLGEGGKKLQSMERWLNKNFDDQEEQNEFVTALRADVVALRNAFIALLAKLDEEAPLAGDYETELTPLPMTASESPQEPMLDRSKPKQM
jgi:hypothetical protein